MSDPTVTQEASVLTLYAVHITFNTMYITSNMLLYYALESIFLDQVICSVRPNLLSIKA